MLPPRTALNAALLPIAEPQQAVAPRLPEPPKAVKGPEGPQLVYDVETNDGFKLSSTSLSEIFNKISESIQEMRTAYRMPAVPMGSTSFEVIILDADLGFCQPLRLLHFFLIQHFCVQKFGMKNHGLQHLLEQLPGAGNCTRYQPKYFKQLRSGDDDELSPVKENLTGCGRSEGFSERKEVDKFGWLASRHRKVPRMADVTDDSLTNR